MLAVQYQTLQQPDTVDTRDEWQLKERLKVEQEAQVHLLQEERKYRRQLEGYEQKLQEGKEAALQETVQELRERAGLTEKTGPGIRLHLAPLLPGGVGAVPVLSPQLLQRLVNELYTYGAGAIQIADQRIVLTTPIREINGRLSVNGAPLPALPMDIEVISGDAQKLYDRMKVSSSFDYFAIDNIELTMTKEEHLILRPSSRPVRLPEMREVKKESGDK
nr:DUF881 domain-containing protein [Ectobacillus ponti]